MLTNAEQALLALLRENARASTAELARRLGVSRTTCRAASSGWRRAASLPAMGAASRDYEQGLVRAHVLLTVTPKLADRVVGELRALPVVKTLTFGQRQFRYDRRRGRRRRSATSTR